MEAADRFGGLVGAAIFIVSADMVPPGGDSTGDTGEHPLLDFVEGFGGEAELRGSVLIHGHGFGNDFVPAKDAVDEFSVEGVFLEAGVVGAGLGIEEHDL